MLLQVLLSERDQNNMCFFLENSWISTIDHMAMKCAICGWICIHRVLSSLKYTCWGHLRMFIIKFHYSKMRLHKAHPLNANQIQRNGRDDDFSMTTTLSLSPPLSTRLVGPTWWCERSQEAHSNKHIPWAPLLDSTTFGHKLSLLLFVLVSLWVKSLTASFQKNHLINNWHTLSYFPFLSCNFNQLISRDNHRNCVSFTGNKNRKGIINLLNI